MSATIPARLPRTGVQCLAPERAEGADGVGRRYGRLLPDLPPLAEEERALHALGVAGGPCDGGTRASADDARGEAGWPFFGQFVAHDITADRSPLVHRADAERLENFRVPRANLECVYGGGPVGSPYLYARDDPDLLLLAESGFDAPRNQEGVAIIGDPRNDVHLFVNQLQVGFIRAHNRLVERLRAARVPPGDVFERARTELTWHYQWIVLQEFLPLVAGDDMVAEVSRAGARFFTPGAHLHIPLEFADAAFRYGHSQVRHDYQVRRDGPVTPMFPDLLGFGPVPAEHEVQWSLLFDVPGSPAAQRAKRIDGCLPRSLISLPVQITGEVDDVAYRSLAARDLQRGLATGLPSGEAVAARFGVPVLSPDEIGLTSHGWEGDTPLWYYVLREADVLADGDRLGAAGARIVAEVLIGILDRDPAGFRCAAPEWTPTLPARIPGAFKLVDLLAPAA